MATFAIAVVGATSLDIVRGQNSRATFNITNTGSTPALARLRAEVDAPGRSEWVTTGRPTLQIAGRGTASLEITIDLPGDALNFTFRVVAAHASAPDDDWTASPDISIRVVERPPEDKPIPIWMWALPAGALVVGVVALIVAIVLGVREPPPPLAGFGEPCVSAGDCRSGLPCAPRTDGVLQCGQFPPPPSIPPQPPTVPDVVAFVDGSGNLQASQGLDGSNLSTRVAGTPGVYELTITRPTGFNGITPSQVVVISTAQSADFGVTNNTVLSVTPTNVTVQLFTWRAGVFSLTPFGFYVAIYIPDPVP